MDLALQLIMKQLNKLRTGNDEMKTDIHNKISAVQDKTENRIHAMSFSQEELRNKIGAIRTSQTEFEEKVTETLDKQLKGIRAVVERQAQNLHEKLKSELEAT
jgi:hypothetical protein